MVGPVPPLDELDDEEELPPALVLELWVPPFPPEPP
jgi:hypothetical protein